MSGSEWLCEPWMVAKTGLTVAEHQRRTVDNLVQLRGLAPDLPIVPVVQGWTVADYLLRTSEDHEFLVRWPQTVAERVLGRPAFGFRPAAHVLFDHCPHLAAEFRVGHVPHAFGLEHRIGEGVHVARRRLLEPTVFRRRQAEAELDAKFLKEESNLELQVIRLVHGDIMPVDARLHSWTTFVVTALSESGRSQRDRGLAELPHLGELLSGAGEADLQSFDLAEPASFGGLAYPFVQVGDDLGEAHGLGRVGPEYRASKAGVLVAAAWMRSKSSPSTAKVASTGASSAAACSRST